jgi:hypothetical protein
VADTIRKDVRIGLAAASPKPKRSPEIVVEVDLDAPKGKATAPKTHEREIAMAAPKPKRSPEIVAEVELE